MNSMLTKNLNWYSLMDIYLVHLNSLLKLLKLVQNEDSRLMISQVDQLKVANV